MKRPEKRDLLLMKNIIQDSRGYDKGIQAIARKLSRGDKFLAEELRNEMHIAILNMERGHEAGYYFRAAKNKAIDYIKSKARNYSYRNATKHISLEAMEETGFQIDAEGNIYAPQRYSAVDMNDWDDPE